MDKTFRSKSLKMHCFDKVYVTLPTRNARRYTQKYTEKHAY